MKSMKSLFVVGILVLVSGLFSCGSGNQAVGDSWDYLVNVQVSGVYPEIDPVKVKGGVILAGSSTLHPLNEAVVQRFRDEGYTGALTLDSIGSGAGFERWAGKGETDVAAASREITPPEISQALKINREPLAFRVCTDALVVAVSQLNGFVENITREDIKLIFSQARTWSQVRPEWPDIPISVFSPGTDSGTFDYFVSKIFDGDPKSLLLSPGIQFSEDDNVLIRGVGETEGGIGFFGYSYYLENRSTLRALAVENIFPTPKTVEEGSYPLARPLFLYTSASVITHRPQVGAFLGYYLSVVREESLQAGFFPLSEEAWEESWKVWFKATGWKDVAEKWLRTP